MGRKEEDRGQGAGKLREGDTTLESGGTIKDKLNQVLVLLEKKRLKLG